MYAGKYILKFLSMTGALVLLALIGHPAYAQETTIVWTMPAWYCEVYVDLLNERLAEDGYDLRLEVNYVELAEEEAYPQEGYASALRECLSDRTADIISCSSIETEAISELVREGYLAELSDYLDSENGQFLKNAFYEEVWESAEVDGLCCLIPSQVGQNGTDYFAINKDYFTEEELNDFDGTIQSLLKLLELKGDEDLAVIWDKDVMTLAFTVGQQYLYGVLMDLETGEVRNLYESDEFLEAAEAVRTMKEEGFFGGKDEVYKQDSSAYASQVENLEFGVWIGSYADSLMREIEENVILVQAPFAFFNRISYSIAINSASEKQQEALELLTLLYTNEEYANLLTWGEEGTDYIVADGIASRTEEGGFATNMMELATGLYDQILPYEGDSFTTDRLETKWNLYEAEGRMDSVVTGFCPDYSAFDDEMRAFSEIADSLAESYLEGKINLAAMQSALEAAGAEKVKTELQTQVTEWMQR